MNTYTVTIEWQVPCFGKTENVRNYTDYAAAMQLVDACKTSASFVSATIKKNSK